MDRVIAAYFIFGTCLGGLRETSV